tara:strand:+ start:6813 stop:7397 length:585 start_codon:yes stop_codon:yes gene_type:complete
MLRKIKVYGRLRKFLGQSEFEAEVNNVREAFSFLTVNFKDLKKHMADQLYHVRVGQTQITEDLVDFNASGDICVVPVASGNIFGIVLGLGALFGGSALSTATFFGAGILSSALTAIGTSMVLNGVTSMLAPEQEVASQSMMSREDPAALATNYSFNNLSNVSKAGVPVPIVYGEIFVGSITIGNGVDTVQVKQE